jgi:hypothetical protein
LKKQKDKIQTAVEDLDNCQSPPSGDLGGLDMKRKIIALIICIACISTAYAQNFSTEFLSSINQRRTSPEFFGIVTQRNISVVTVNSSMIESLRRREQNREVQAFLSELDFLRIMTVDNPRNAAAFHTTALTLLSEKTDFEELLSIEEGRQQVLIKALTPENNRTPEIVMISYIHNASLTIVNITGNVDISDLSQLATTIRNLR